MNELVPFEPEPPTLFGSNPELAVEKMADLSRVLMDVVRDRKLSAHINGKEFLTTEAWTTLATLVGLSAVIEWTRPLDNGWEARAVVQMLDGRIVAAGEAMCTTEERAWKGRPAHQVRAMAQTRALGRSLRGPLGCIVALAGYSTAASEEVTDSDPIAPQPDQPTILQRQQMNHLFGVLKDLAPDSDWLAACRRIAGPGDELTEAGAELVIEKMRDWVEGLGGEEA
jgi:hypothetical protein